MTSLPREPLGRPLRLAVLISGGGTTLANLFDVIARGELEASIELVIASRPDCGGLAHAVRTSRPGVVISPKKFSSTHEFSLAIFDQCRAAGVDVVVLAGFLCLIEIPPDFEWRVMNIHPALIPSFCGPGFYGEKVHAAALARGVKVTGCTVHFVDNQYDHGPIILQRCVHVLDTDDPHSLAARVFAAECAAYPQALRHYAAGDLRAEQGRVTVRQS